MKKLLGIIVFLLILYGALLFSDPGARSAGNHYNLGERIGMNGILTLGAGLLIITGGLDLSLGSLVGLCATMLAVLLVDKNWHPLLAMAAVLDFGRRFLFARELHAVEHFGGFHDVGRDRPLRSASPLRPRLGRDGARHSGRDGFQKPATRSIGHALLAIIRDYFFSLNPAGTATSSAVAEV